MPHIDELFPSPFLKASDVAHSPVVTIRRIEIEEVSNSNGEKEEKPIVFFGEFEKGMVLNKTNAQVIASLYGDDTDDWIGARLTLYKAMVQAYGEMKPAIRIMDQKPQASKPEAIAAYRKIYDRAREMNLPLEGYVLDADSPVENIIKLGRELSGKIKAAKAAAQEVELFEE